MAKRKVVKAKKSVGLNMDENRGTLQEGEHHVAADIVLTYLKGLSPEKLAAHQEALSSCAIEGNRMAEVCSETLRRVLAHEPVSDRYLLGLAWTIRDMEEKQ